MLATKQLERAADLAEAVGPTSSTAGVVSDGELCRRRAKAAIVLAPALQTGTCGPTRSLSSSTKYLPASGSRKTSRSTSTALPLASSRTSKKARSISSWKPSTSSSPGSSGIWSTTSAFKRYSQQARTARHPFPLPTGACGGSSSRQLQSSLTPKRKCIPVSPAPQRYPLTPTKRYRNRPGDFAALSPLEGEHRPDVRKESQPGSSSPRLQQSRNVIGTPRR